MTKILRWYDQESVRGGPEAFWPGAHKTYSQLEEERNSNDGASRLPCSALTSKSGNVIYECIADSDRLMDRNINYCFRVTRLRHLTRESAAMSICNHGGFIGKLKEVATIRPPQVYSWWSIHIEDCNYRQMAHSVADYLASQFPTGNKRSVEVLYPFVDRGHLYGDHSFIYDINEMLIAYRNQFCHGLDIMLRIMGTFVYNQQIMHAVVVHSSRYNRLFQHLPLVADYRAENRVYKGPDEVLYWCPESVVRVVVQPYSPWEQLCFAFHLPDGQLFKLDNPFAHCSIVECDGFQQ